MFLSINLIYLNLYYITYNFGINFFENEKSEEAMTYDALPREKKSIETDSEMDKYQN